jgi:hypothetical protein
LSDPNAPATDSKAAKAARAAEKATNELPAPATDSKAAKAARAAEKATDEPLPATDETDEPLPATDETDEPPAPAVEPATIKCAHCGSEDIPRTVEEITLRLAKVTTQERALLARVEGGASRAETRDEFEQIVCDYYHAIRGIEACERADIEIPEDLWDAAMDQDGFMDCYYELYDAQREAAEQAADELQRNRELLLEKPPNSRRLKHKKHARIPPKCGTREPRPDKTFLGKGALSRVSVSEICE